MPVDAITAVGPEWQIALPTETGAAAAAPAAEGSGFGAMFANQIGGLQQLQNDAATQGNALATGTAEDASQVVMAVERAQLAMQLASTLRDKSVEAFQEIFRTQV
jgi:flagellar hook-basal body complex protein FliE